MPHDVSPTGSGSRETAFAASFRAQWAHFLAAIAGEATAPVARRSTSVLRGGRGDLPVRRGRPRRHAVTLAGSLALLPACDPAGGGADAARRPSPPISTPGADAHRSPADVRPGAGGLGALRSQRPLDPRSGSHGHRVGLRLWPLFVRQRTSSLEFVRSATFGTRWAGRRPRAIVGYYHRWGRSGVAARARSPGRGPGGDAAALRVELAARAPRVRLQLLSSTTARPAFATRSIARSAASSVGSATRCRTA